MKPYAFKVRTPGAYTGENGGRVRSGSGGAGLLWYEDKTFTVAAMQDQYIAVPQITLPTTNKMSLDITNIPKHKPLRYLSCCSGIEAASVAWEPLGWIPVGFSEIEPFPSAVLKHRFPNTPNYGDLTNYKQWPLSRGDVDLIIAGTPCQAFSVAGLRQGLADPRGNLALIFLGLVDHLRPKYVIWENVPGVYSSSGGSDFASFLSAFSQLGYSIAYRTLDAQNFGVPQRRKRCWCVAIDGTANWQTAAEILFEPESFPWHPSQVREETEDLTSDVGKGTATGSRSGGAEPIADPNQLNLFADPEPVHHATVGVAGTLLARDYKGPSNQSVESGNTIPVTNPGIIVLDRASFCQGTNAKFAPSIKESNIVPTLVAQGPHAVQMPPENIVAPTVTTCKGSKGGSSAETIDELIAIHNATIQTPAVIAPPITATSSHCPQTSEGTAQVQAVYAAENEIAYRKSKRAQTVDDHETWVADGIANTLNGFDIGDTRTTHAIIDPIALQGSVINFGESSQQGGPGFNTDGSMYTLTKTDVHGVVYENHPNDSRITGPVNIAPTVVSRFGTGGGNVPLVNTEPVMAFDTYNQTVSNVSQTLTCAASDPSHVGTVLVPKDTDPAVPLDGMNLLSRLGEASSEHSLQNFVPGDPQFTLTKGHHHGVITPMAVRRLTPTECLRLQGFPDDWTLIPWKGKPASDCPDGPQYKAIGNSMAVPCVRWIGMRIAAVESKTI